MSDRLQEIFDFGSSTGVHNPRTRPRIHSIDYRGSVADGPGLRTVLYVQGCSRRCPDCHNPATWNHSTGTSVDVCALSQVIRENSKTQRLTISGGEPLEQIDGVLSLSIELADFDLALSAACDDRRATSVHSSFQVQWVASKTFRYDLSIPGLPIGCINLRNRLWTVALGWTSDFRADSDFLRAHHSPFQQRRMVIAFWSRLTLSRKV